MPQLQQNLNLNGKDFFVRFDPMEQCYLVRDYEIY